MPTPMFVAGEAVAASKLQQLAQDDTISLDLEATTTNPTLGVGAGRGGTLWVNGQAVDLWFRIQFGTSPSAGSGEYEIPLPAAYPPATAMPAGAALGTVDLTDNSTGDTEVGVLVMDATNTRLKIKIAGTSEFVSNSAPWTWGANDSISGHARWFTDFEGGVSVGDDPAVQINLPWQIDTFVTPTVTTGTGGVEYTIRPGANSISDWNTALGAMNATGGNVIRFLAGQHNGEYRVRGDLIAGGGLPYGNAPAGVAGNHNIITADAGAIITGVQQGGFPYPAVSVEATAHWDVIGLTINGSDFQCLRYMYVTGTAGSRCRIMGNTLSNPEAAVLKVRGWFENAYNPSTYIDVDGNTLDGGDRVRAVPEFNEGFYVGTGYDPPTDLEWVDLTNNIRFRQNLVLRCQSDSLELKTGVDQIEITDNIFHSANLVAGTGGTSIPVGHITIIYANTARPGGDVAANVLFARNRVYGMAQASGTVRPPIIVGQGGPEIWSNIVWGCEAAAACHIDSGAGGMGTGIIFIDHNTSDGSFVSNVDAYGSITAANNVPDEAAPTFAGPTTGTADNEGQGPGSGFAITSLQGTAVVSARPDDATGAPANDPADPGALAVVP